VLIATGQVDGRWQILIPPHSIEIHEPTATNFRTIDTSARGPPKPNLVQIHPIPIRGRALQPHRPRLPSGSKGHPQIQIHPLGVFGQMGEI